MAEGFRKQLRFLKRHYQVITPQEFLQLLRAGKAFPENSVLLTCDDGLLNHRTEMLPILQEEGLACLFFVTGLSAEDTPQALWYEELYLVMMGITAERAAEIFSQLGVDTCPGRSRRMLWSEAVKRLSGRTWNQLEEFLQEVSHRAGLAADWRKTYLQDPVRERRFQLLTRQDLKQLLAAGMTIGAHSMTHCVLSALAAEFAWKEISQSRQSLEEALGVEVWAMAYPYGDWGAVGVRECQLAERAGYACAFMNVDEAGDVSTSPFRIPRVHVTRDMSLAEFEAHVSGYHRRLRERFSQPGPALAIGAAN
jgi:peptidoglycan/xylan/chitin deacetylase (PgdA/CDA1 family)